MGSAAPGGAQPLEQPDATLPPPAGLALPQLHWRCAGCSCQWCQPSLDPADQPLAAPMLQGFAAKPAAARVAARRMRVVSQAASTEVGLLFHKLPACDVCWATGENCLLLHRLARQQG